MHLIDFIHASAANQSPFAFMVAVVILPVFGTYFMKYGVHVNQPGGWKTLAIGYPALFGALLLVVVNIIVTVEIGSDKLMAVAVLAAGALAFWLTRLAIVEQPQPLTKAEQDDLYDADIPQLRTSRSDARRVGYADAVRRRAAANAA